MLAGEFVDLAVLKRAESLPNLPAPSPPNSRARSQPKALGIYSPTLAFVRIQTCSLLALSGNRG